MDNSIFFNLEECHLNILIINPSLRPESQLKLFPVGLGYIVTAMKQAGFSFDLIDIDAYRYTDQEVENLIKKKAYDIVCMGCIVTGYKIIKDLTNVIRRFHDKAIIVVGNSVATSIPDILLTNTDTDIAVMGEGDITIIELLKALKNKTSLHDVEGICFVEQGKIVHTRPRSVIKDISVLPYIDFSLFDIEIYIENSRLRVNDPLPIPREQVRALPINTARGCIAKCTFCYHVFKDVPYRYRSPQDIVSEIRDMLEKYDLNFILFSDELTFFSKKQASELVEEFLASGLKFYWTGTCRAGLFDSEDDIYLLQRMKEAGCIGMAYSLESSNIDILKSMNKHITVEQFSKQTKLIQKANLPTWTSLVFGYPQETPETIQNTIDCCIDNNIYPSAGYLLPQPGSYMYEYAVENKYIVDEEKYLIQLGDRQDLRINLTTMTDEVFQENVIQAMKRCNESLNVGLAEDKLIKTQHYRAAEKRELK